MILRSLDSQSRRSNRSSTLSIAITSLQMTPRNLPRFRNFTASSIIISPLRLETPTSPWKALKMKVISFLEKRLKLSIKVVLSICPVFMAKPAYYLTSLRTNARALIPARTLFRLLTERKSMTTLTLSLMARMMMRLY
jgi:hypothetical protein